MIDLTAIGEVLIDLTQMGDTDSGIPLFAANPGGAPANVAVAAARLGAQTAFLGKVGQDGLGRDLTRVLAENGVDCSGLRSDPLATTMAVVSVDRTGERNFSFLRGADAQFTLEDVAQEVLSHSRFLHFGSVSLTMSPAREAVLYAVGEARRCGALISYDPNYRQALWPSRAKAEAQMRRPLPLVDVLKLSQEELPMLSGTDDLDAGTARLEEQGISLVLVTLGKSGVFYRLYGRTGQVPGVPVQVADTNGAGDTFLGAVLSRLCRRGGRPLENLTPAGLEPLLAFANRAAALTCSRSGAIPAMPTLAELNE